MMNCLRFMESSRTRNSILDWLLAATLAVAVISGLAGIDFEIGSVAFRSHSAWRVLVLSAILVAIRRWMGIDSWPRWLTRVALLAAISGSAVTWLRFLLTTIGGADSYGYVSASELLARGLLVAGAPVADWLSAVNRLAIASPLGWTPAADGTGIAPLYPLGVPALTEDEINALIAFMEALTDEAVLYRKAPFDHPQLFVPNGHPGDQSSVEDDGRGLATDILVEIPEVGANGGPPLPGFLDEGPFGSN